MQFNNLLDYWTGVRHLIFQLTQLFNNNDIMHIYVPLGPPQLRYVLSSWLSAKAC